ncbi:MAG: bacillithiol biosynthesis protein BshC [Planctomycetota bacterium]|jgi:uncharacterized protein YllA (UPF0747 family)
MLRSEPLPGSPDSPTARPDLRAAARPHEREELASAIAEHQRSLGALEPAIRGAESLARPDAAVIVTGQQPGLLGGPLLGLAKALTAVAWARRLAADTSRPVVPVFWVAAEDHDLDEVNRAVLLTQADEVRTLRLPLEPDGRMLSEIDPAGHAEALLAEAEELLPASTFRARVVDSLRPSGGASLGRWFGEILARWLSGEGLVVVEPRLLREPASAVLRLERERPGAISKAVQAGPVTPSPVPFFLVEDGVRRRPRSAADLPEDPAGVSWDVLTRVLAQNAALPVAGHVVGPAELEYCRQVAPVHDLLGIPAPPLLPRASLVLVEGKVERALGRFEASVGDVLEEGEDVLRAEFEPGEFDSALSRLEEALESAYEDVRKEAGVVDEVLRRKAEGAARELTKSIERLRGHGRRALERATGMDLERRLKVLAHLLPLGQPQDRVLSPVPFLVRHGFGLIRRLLEVVTEWPEGRRAVYLSGTEEAP